MVYRQIQREKQQRERGGERLCQGDESSGRQVVFYWILVVRQILRRFDADPFLRPPPVPPLPGDKGNHQIKLSGGQEAQVTLILRFLLPFLSSSNSFPSISPPSSRFPPILSSLPPPPLTQPLPHTAPIPPSPVHPTHPAFPSSSAFAHFHPP